MIVNNATDYCVNLWEILAIWNVLFYPPDFDLKSR